MLCYVMLFYLQTFVSLNTFVLNVCNDQTVFRSFVVVFFMKKWREWKRGVNACGLDYKQAEAV